MSVARRQLGSLEWSDSNKILMWHLDSLESLFDIWHISNCDLRHSKNANAGSFELISSSQSFKLLISYA